MLNLLKLMMLVSDIFNILHIRKHYCAVTRRNPSQFLAAIAEETTKKAYISYESFPRFVKLFIENYPGYAVTVI